MQNIKKLINNIFMDLINCLNAIKIYEINIILKVKQTIIKLHKYKINKTKIN